MATLPTLLQPKTLPIKADPVGPPMPTRQERAEADLAKAEAGIGETRKKELEQDIRQAEIRSEMDVTKAREGARITREERKAIEESEPYKRSQAVATELMNQRFQPTQRSAQENAAIFSLINVLGLYIGRGGKQTSQQALAAMNGMLEGKQAGDAQRFREEKIKFDTNLRALNQTYQTLNTELKRISDLAARDKQAAAQELDVLLAQKGADFLKANIAKVGLEKTRIDLENAAKASKRIIEREAEADRRAAEKAEQERQRAETRMRELAFQRETQKVIKGLQPPAKPEIYQDEETGQLYAINPQTLKVEKVETPEGVRLGKPGAKAKAASAGGTGGAVQFRYNAAMTNAGNALAIELDNAASLPIGATPPAAAEVLTNPSKSLTDAARSYFAQSITPPEERAMQQILAGMSRAITTIEASGRPSGATESAIKEFGKIAPRAGDQKINTYLFLAQATQVMDILVKDLKASGGTKEQIDQAIEARDGVKSLINWTVRDINRILRGPTGRSLVDENVQRSIQQSQTLEEFESTIGRTAAPAPGAAQPRATLNGRAIVVRDGKWVYEDTGSPAQ